MWAIGLTGMSTLLLTCAAIAADMGHARFGDDYAQFKIDGTDWRRCEHECAVDTSCKSWTYLTTTGQCRLKHSVPPKTANACCVTGVKGEAVVAEQAIPAAPVPSAPMVPDAPVVSDTPLAEPVTRDGLLCDHYARMAVAEIATSTQNNCGFAGPEWSGDYQNQLRSCRQSEQAGIAGRIAARERQLLECLSRTAGPEPAADSSDCDAYASQSVEQYREAARMRCGDVLLLPGWSEDAGLHFRWCRTHSTSRRQTFLQQRQAALDNCGSGRGRDRFRRNYGIQ